jgi:hypothetical protein
MEVRERERWVEVPVDRIAVRMHPERGPVQMRIIFADGTHREVPVESGLDASPLLEEVLCDKARLVDEQVPCWWG